jgi:glycosyltransferase involved in cell wall biosynthesis
MSKLVSVLMTSYNREQYVAEAIESVLASAYTNFELIIVDDCSTDSTVSIARAYEVKDQRVKVFQNKKNLGQFQNRNKAASYATGVFIKYFDSDDIMYPDCLDVMISAMEKYPETGAGAITLHASASNLILPLEYSPKECYINHFFKANPLLYIGPSGGIFKRAVFNEFNGFDETIGILADTLLMLKIAAKYNIATFRDDLFYWRIHDAQVTVGQKDWFEMQRQRAEINNIVLNSPDIPLLPSETKIIKRNLKNILVRNIVKRFIVKQSFKECLQLSKICKLRFIDYIHAIILNKKLA